MDSLQLLEMAVGLVLLVVAFVRLTIALGGELLVVVVIAEVPPFVLGVVPLVVVVAASFQPRSGIIEPSQGWCLLILFLLHRWQPALSHWYFWI